MAIVPIITITGHPYRTVTVRTSASALRQATHCAPQSKSTMRRRQARPASNSGVSPGRDAGRSSVSDVLVLLVVGLFVVVLMSVRNMGTSAQSMVVGAASPAAPAHTRAKQVAASHRAAKRLDELVNMAAAAEIRRRGDNAAAVEGISVTADSVVIQRAEQDLHEQIGSAIVQDSGQSGMMETGAVFFGGEGWSFVYSERADLSY